MKRRLDVWDDDDSDELFYVDRYVPSSQSSLNATNSLLLRSRWRHIRARRLEAEEANDEKSRKYEEQEAENLRKESEEFLARQMDEMQSLAEEQRKAGMLLDDGAPVRLNVSIAPPSNASKDAAGADKGKGKGVQKPAVVLEDDEEETGMKRKAPLVKLDFSVAESGEQIRERLMRIRESVPSDPDTLFKAKVRWDAVSDVRAFTFAGNLWLILGCWYRRLLTASLSR